MTPGVESGWLGAVSASLTPIALHDALRATASRADAPGNDFGWGIVNAAAALAHVNTSSEASPQVATWRVWPTVLSAGGTLSIETPEAPRLSVYDVLARRVGRLEHGGGVSRRPLPRVAPGVYLIAADEGAIPAVEIVVR